MKFKPIPGFEKQYAISIDGDVLDLKTRKLCPVFIIMNNTNRVSNLWKRVKINGKNELVAKLMIVAYMGCRLDAYVWIEYRDNDPKNTNIYNIRFNYRKKSKGFVTKKYIDYMAYIQKNSLCNEVEDLIE